MVEVSAKFCLHPRVWNATFTLQLLKGYVQDAKIAKKRSKGACSPVLQGSFSHLDQVHMCKEIEAFHLVREIAQSV
jgi:hypothetical protein